MIDIRDKVHVYAGKEFWSWLNNGEAETQHWVLEGIERAVKEADIKEKIKILLKNSKNMLQRSTMSKF
ncbi:type II restriction endonuclease [Escherichia coli DEC4D]|nr:type II restriction endonuclease [Escherichia coli DEC4D]